MKKNRTLLLLTMAGAMFTFGCSQDRAKTPDVTGAIKDQLKANNLGDVKVAEDRDKGVVTLSGDVQNEQEKANAESIAKQNAAGMIVANEVGIRPNGEQGAAKKVDENLDKGIEDNYRAAITAHRMDNQHIHFNAKNGVLTLKGDVDTMAQRDSAEQMGAKIPGVTQVVNELQVKNAKHGHRAAPAGE